MASSAETIANAVKEAVPKTCGTLAGIAAVVRKKADLLDNDPVPLIVVCIARDGDREHLWAGKDAVRYIVSATLITEAGAKVANDPATQQWQESAEAALNAPSSYTGGINEVWPSSKRPFDAGGLKATKNYTTVAARVEVLEDRTY